MIPLLFLFLFSVAIDHGQCSNNIRITEQTAYAGRFLVKYYPTAVQDFLFKSDQVRKIKEESKKGTNQTSFFKLLAHAELDTLSIILPECSPSSFDEEDYNKAIKIRTALFNKLLEDPEDGSQKLFYHDPQLASQFAQIIIHNLLGDMRELEFPIERDEETEDDELWEFVLDKGTTNKIAIERNFENLAETFYRIIKTVIDKMDQKTPLYMEFRQKDFLLNLARLLQSPERKERDLVANLLHSLTSKDLDEDGSTRQIASEILWSLFFNFKFNKENEASLRPIPHAIDLLRSILISSFLTRKHSEPIIDISSDSFFKIFQRMAIPLIEMSDYPYYSVEYFDLVNAVLSMLDKNFISQEIHLKISLLIVNATIKKLEMPTSFKVPMSRIAMITNLFTNNVVHPNATPKMLQKLFLFSLSFENSNYLLALSILNQFASFPVRQLIFGTEFRQQSSSLQVIEIIARFFIKILSLSIDLKQKEGDTKLIDLASDLCKLFYLKKLALMDDDFGQGYGLLFVFSRLNETEEEEAEEEDVVDVFGITEKLIII